MHSTKLVLVALLCLSHALVLSRSESVLVRFEAYRYNPLQGPFASAADRLERQLMLLYDMTDIAEEYDDSAGSPRDIGSFLNRSAAYIFKTAKIPEVVKESLNQTRLWNNMTELHETVRTFKAILHHLSKSSVPPSEQDQYLATCFKAAAIPVQARLKGLQERQAGNKPTKILLSSLSSFNKTFPTTPREAMLRRRLQQSKEQCSPRGIGRRLELKPVLLPAEIHQKMLVEQFELRLAYLGIESSKIQFPQEDRQVINIIEEGEAFAELVRNTKELPRNQSAWGKAEQNILSYHLCKAAALGDIGTLEKLILHGARASWACPPWGDTPLHAACRAGEGKAASFLIARGANPHALTEMEGWTPLHMASASGNRDLVELLLRIGSRVTLQGPPPFDLNAFDCAIVNGIDRSDPVVIRLQNTLENVLGRRDIPTWEERMLQEKKQKDLELKQMKMGIQTHARIIPNMHVHVDSNLQDRKRRTLLDSMQTQEYDRSDRSNRISVLHGEKREENPSNFTLGPSKTQEMEFDTSDDLL
ncbi:hypothetical protein GUITHDRAFT_137837 [Guillardia theta CCMP2712]|uniref:Uncharacterized protein n=1 Tax=Guillardia theta (strain CCMP2712) TaxID=905079 RepID=L1JE86_GUITC|nr:hypothetical protein GUITHDRAFT_137837 [Guillardia theta CCMP2712]EKX46833.1 hypothetical protein GUITHDRAFT_137837 [Guillardia theta CCMP2712]|eukprot:XP_005833813.1 hypothetical protein GUITHDRAFT_137837 [Guillardia theta CCMP2712]